MMVIAPQPLHLLSLCAGIGGVDLAAEWAGIVIGGQVERDPLCRRILAQHWPQVPRMTDIREVQGNEFGVIDILAAGLPCQGNSCAGKRRGRDDPRNLWPDFCRLLCATGARWAVVENVPGLLRVNGDSRSRDHGLFGDILRDLARLRYTAGWYVLPAAFFGAPHRRARLFVVAHREVADANGLRWDGGRDHWQARYVHHDQERDDTPPCADGQELQSQPGADDASAHERTQSRVGRSVDGIPYRVDGCSWPGWPARPGATPYAYEPPHTTNATQAERVLRLKALGNALIPRHIADVFDAIVAWEQMR